MGPLVPPDALDRFFQELFPVIRAKCARMLGDGELAADIAQETFLRLWSSPVAAEPPAARLKWAYQTSTRLAIDHLRRRRLGVEVPATFQSDAPDAAAGAEAVIDARKWLERLVAMLSATELEVAILSRVDRLTQDEVAEVTEMSSRSVRRVLARLDRHLEGLARSLS
jgi:RNA polymerase sigma-70 factor (ECF subfamily)